MEQTAERPALVLDSRFEIGINSVQKGTTSAHSETLGCNLSAYDHLVPAIQPPTLPGAQLRHIDTIPLL